MSFPSMMFPVPMKGAFLSLESTDTWVLVAFLLFCGILIFAGVPGFISRALDARADRIRRQISEARELRDEAQRKLAEAERRLKAAETQAQEIVGRARDEATEMAKAAKAEVENAVARRLQSAADQLMRAEEDAVRSVRNTAVDAAVGAVQHVLKSDLSPDGRGKLLGDSVDEVVRRLS